MLRRLAAPITTVDETWKRATDAIRQAARLELGTTKPGRGKVDKQTWLWTDDVKTRVREEKSRYHIILGDNTADNWQKYKKAKKAAKKAVAVAKATQYSMSTKSSSRARLETEQCQTIAPRLCLSLEFGFVFTCKHDVVSIQQRPRCRHLEIS
ncbi:unnamed protein product [Heligmosomoides polygyrus]|uniref:Reverse transcriptase domain-containing protein n=1 Tax=Heligmosomoides polygyrus TaxID=6339 RepID=A0A183FW07_HELPZ|nr:unnamed protein product [Heligmosomoides polygyrus]